MTFSKNNNNNNNEWPGSFLKRTWHSISTQK